jgi:oligopeptide/dipeptide ABC transporter ATP-binding protein
MMTDQPILQIKNLYKHFPINRTITDRFKRRPPQVVHAVDGVDLDLGRGEILALVGESGSGKTTVGMNVLGLQVPTEGRILFDGYDVAAWAKGQLKSKGNGDDLTKLSRRKQILSLRRRAQMVFQDPYESLNPRRTIFDTVVEPLVVQGIGDLVEREERVANLLELVGLTPADTFMFRFPHELSGGQRQRVAIARALIIDPAFIVADEPTSMLDVSIRIGVMQLMQELADRFDVSYLYITHDLAVARYMCQDIAVMYLGKLVEMAETEELLAHPLHPYTQALISAVPIPDPRLQRETIEIKGGVAQPIDPPPYCRFYDRCPFADDFCRDNDHSLLEDKGDGHMVACHKI